MLTYQITYSYITNLVTWKNVEGDLQKSDTFAWGGSDCTNTNQQKTELEYDMIIGSETFSDLGIVIDFQEKQIIWNDISVEMKDPTLFDIRKNLYSLALQAEPESFQDIQNWALHILNAGREGDPNLKQVVKSYKHLDQPQQDKLLALLNEYEELFDGKLGLWKTKPVALEIKPDDKPYHGKAFLVPHIHKKKIQTRNWYSSGPWGVGKGQLQSMGRPILHTTQEEPQQTKVLMQLLRSKQDHGKKALCFSKNKWDPPRTHRPVVCNCTGSENGILYNQVKVNAQRLCTIITPWEKYKYKRFSMGINTALDIFQNKISNVMRELEFVKVYLGNLLIITNESF